MKKDKKNIGWALFEGLCELVLTLLGLGIGVFIIGLFDVDFESSNANYDLIILVGLVVFFVSFAIICALVEWFKKIIGSKRK